MARDWRLPQNRAVARNGPINFHAYTYVSMHSPVKHACMDTRVFGITSCVFLCSRSSDRSWLTNKLHKSSMVSTAAGHRVVTRFAPSPTGFLHLGGLRTALFSFLLARSSPSASGRFILRIEDTDTKRTVPGAAKALAETLNLFGLTYDEGTLLQTLRGRAYTTTISNAFCPRNQFTDASARPTCRLVQQRQSEVSSHIAAGKPYTVRLKIPPGMTAFDDGVHGRVEVSNTTLDDAVLMKSTADAYGDGPPLPTYHFANVVDDAEMGVTHVVRGDEWIASTPKHVLLYRALGWEDRMPQFYHVPLLVDTSGRKLSKRNGDVNVESFLEKGYLPEALLNFVGLLGFTPPVKKELWFLEDFIKHQMKKFKPEHLSKSAATVSYDQLNRLNRLHIGHILKFDTPKRTAILQSIRAEFLMKYQARLGQLQMTENLNSEANFVAVLDAVLPQITVTSQFSEAIAGIYLGPDLSNASAVNAMLLGASAVPAAAFEQLVQTVQALPVSAWRPLETTDGGEDAVKAAIRQCSVDTGVPRGALLRVVRVAVTGLLTGADLGRILRLVGRDAVLSRLEAFPATAYCVSDENP
ncbi:hypothetical protein HDU84_000795 [Entophlyctis sp. JEL0112]|nr:hypothetical protein HDU84_000795 [Entophlyctis sp. JEL0112]